MWKLLAPGVGLVDFLTPGITIIKAETVILDQFSYKGLCLLCLNYDEKV